MSFFSHKLFSKRYILRLINEIKVWMGWRKRIENWGKVLDRPTCEREKRLTLKTNKGKWEKNQKRIGGKWRQENGLKRKNKMRTLEAGVEAPKISPLPLLFPSSIGLFSSYFHHDFMISLNLLLVVLLSWEVTKPFCSWER